MTALAVLAVAVAAGTVTLLALSVLAALVLRTERPVSARSLPPGPVLALPASREGTE